MGGESGESVGICEAKVENEMLECVKRVAEDKVMRLNEEKVELDAGVVMSRTELWKMNGIKRLDERVALQAKCGGLAGDGERALSLSTSKGCNSILHIQIPDYISDEEVSSVNNDFTDDFLFVMFR